MTTVNQPMDAAEFACKTNAYLTEYIKVADAKAAAILTFTALVGAVVSATSERVLTASRTAAPWLVGVSALILLAVAGTVAMILWHTFWTLLPRTQTANKSLNSFPDIASMSPEDFAKQVGSLTADTITTHYSLHNHTLATIANAKFESLKRAMRWLRLTLCATFALALLYAVTTSTSKGSPKTEAGQQQSFSAPSR